MTDQPYDISPLEIGDRVVLAWTPYDRTLRGLEDLHGKIATVVGCCHGQQDEIVKCVEVACYGGIGAWPRHLVVPLATALALGVRPAE